MGAKLKHHQLPRPGLRQLFLIALIPAAACLASCSRESELVQASKCAKAGIVLEDDFLKHAGLRRVAELGKAALSSPREIGALNEELNNQLGHSDAGKYLKTVAGWRDSGYCTTLVEGARAEAAAMVKPLLDPVHPGMNGSMPCEALQARVAALRNPILSEHTDALKSAVDKVVDSAVRSSLKDYQQKTIMEGSANSRRQMTDAVHALCAKGAVESVNQALLQLPQIQTLASPRTHALLSMSQASGQGSRDCGAQPDLFCLDRLKAFAINSALSHSKRCDTGASEAQNECEADADTLVDKYLRAHQLKALESKRTEVMRVLEDNRSIPGDLFLTSDVFKACTGEAIDKGLRGDAYQRFKETECEARAKLAYLAPFRARLKLIHELIAQLR